MNNQIIANHPRLSVLIYFICTDMNNQMIANHPRLSANDKHIIQKSRLVSLSSVYSPIQLYIRIYNRTNPYITLAE